jgi:ZIP family zinc transporter
LHNIPEGIAVAVPFRSAGFPAWRCAWYATAAGLIEPITALAGIFLVGAVKGLIPFALAFAGGAMLYVVSDELIPESHSHGYEHQASFGFVVGFILLLVLMHVI